MPTVIRAMSLNLGMLSSFDEVKERANAYMGTENALSARLVAASIAGFFAAYFSLPFDNAKTKI